MLARVAVRRSVISAALFGGNACAMSGGPRLPPQVPPHLDAPQQELFDAIVDSRMRIVGRDALFDEAGALRGPWNPEVASPALGRHLERLATAVRAENSLEARVYEVAILAVGAHWRAQFEWYAHEKLARAAGVAEAAFPLMKARAPPEALAGVLAPDELAAYALARELMATQRVSDATYAAAKAALGSDRAMADLAMTMGCYSAVSTILNVFEVALPAGAENPFPEPEA
jgi:4-carboxymuconolactone decarboxylase